MAVSYRSAVMQALEAASAEYAIPTDELLRYARLQDHSREMAGDRPAPPGTDAAAPDSIGSGMPDGSSADPAASAMEVAEHYARIQSDLVSRGRPLLFGSDRPTGVDVHLASQLGGEGYASLQNALEQGRFSRDDTRSNLLSSLGANAYPGLTGAPFTELHALGDQPLARAAMRYWTALDQRLGTEPALAGDGVAVNAQEAWRERSGEVTAPLVWPTPGNWNAATRASEAGVTLVGELGDPVLAVAAGRAAVMPNNGAAGHSVRVHHDDGEISGYRHLDTLPVQHDARVAAGETVGTLGRSGRLAVDADPQVHFQMWREGRALDALEELRARAAVTGRQSERPQDDRSEFVDRMFAAARAADEAGVQQAINAFNSPSARQWEGAASLETTLVEAARPAAEPQR